MKRFPSKAMALISAVAVLGAASVLSAQSKKKDSFTQGKKGEAKEALERSAGQKVKDTKVPEASKPSPVKEGKKG